MSKLSSGKLEELLLEDARKRCDAEDALNNTYQAKSGLLLAFSGGAAALMGQLLFKIGEGWSPQRIIDWLALASVLVSLGLLFYSTWRLLQSAMSAGYTTIATPQAWQTALENARRAYSSLEDGQERAENEFKQEFLHAWVQAATGRATANKVKAELLSTAVKLLKATVVASLVTIVLFAARAATRFNEEARMSHDPSERPAVNEPAPPEEAPQREPESPVAWPPNEDSQRSIVPERSPTIYITPSR